MSARMRCLLIGLSFLLPFSLVAEAPTPQPAVFASPEAAVSCFLEAFRDQDFPRAFSTFAVDKYSSGFNFTAFSRRLNAITFATTFAPSEYPGYAELNRIEALARLARQMRYLYLSILSNDTDFQRTQVAPTDEDLSAFIARVDPALVKKLVVLKVDKSPIVERERYQKIAFESARCFGADEGTERVALVRLGDDLFIMGFHLLRYGQDWKIDTLSSPLAGLPVMGVKKATVEDYLELIE